MEVLIALSVFGFVTALMTAVLSRPGNSVQQRLESYRGMLPVPDDGPEPEPSFAERVLQPLGQWGVRVMRVVLPSTLAEKLQWKLTLAGDPVTLTGLYATWAACAVGLPVMYAFSVMAGGAGFGQQQLGLLVVIAAMGAYLPWMWLGLKISRRQASILKALPDAIDLLSTSVEAGLGIDAALGQVAEKSRGHISTEFRRMLRDMALGSARRDALRGFSDRVDLPDVKVFVNALIQAEQTGVSLGQVIRVQADQMRLRRRQRAEEKAHKAPVKMSIPLVLFIFPTIFVVILGPAVIHVMANFGE